MRLPTTIHPFPACRFARDETDAGLRTCDHPELRGLKCVTTKLCSGCSYREADHKEVTDHAQADSKPSNAELSRLWDCAYLGFTGEFSGHSSTSRNVTEATGCVTEVPQPQPASSLEVWMDGKQFCGHPAHIETTRRQCSQCADYLFPRFSPQMTVDDARSLLAVHRPAQPTHWWKWRNVQQAFEQLTQDALRKAPSYPETYQGRGIVIAGGGRYFPSAYVTIRVLRHVGCQLPIQLWHLAGEMDDLTRSSLSPLDVTCIDAEELSGQQGHRFHPSWWKGWQLKPYAILHAPFEEVLYLDADSYPTRNPEFLFDWRGYCEHGSIFWPDIDGSACLLPPDRPPIFGVPRFHDRPTESGQLLINKRICWRELNLAWFYNSHADFTYRALWGDKDTFPIAWKKLGRPYARMWPTASANSQAVLQYDDAGCLLFQHRATDKFRLPGARFDSTLQRPGENQYNPDLIHEDFCFAALDELRELLAQC